MLVDLKTALSDAKARDTAVGAFNVYNLESVLAVTEAAANLRQPVILAFGEGYLSHAPIEAVAAAVRALCGTADLPVVLHLDHAKSFSTILRAIRCGFTSVMYDGSHLPLAENIANTKKVVEAARAVGVSVEGELGYMNEEDGSAAADFSLEKGYTRVQDAAAYACQTGVDALAIAVGNAHGIYKGTPSLDFERLRQIGDAAHVPLVLHGASGIPFDAIRRAISLGVRKINVNTEVSTTAVRTARAFLDEHTEPNLRFETVLKAARDAMRTTVEEYIRLLAGK